MHWIIPALIAPFLNAIVNFIDKYLVTRQVKNCLAMQLYTSIVSFCFGVLVWAGLGFPSFGGLSVFYELAAGVLFSVAGIGYYYVLSRKDVSDMIFLYALTPVFVFLFANFILREAISYSQFLGFLLILSAAISVSARKKANIPLLSFTAFLILGMDILFALAIVMVKLAFNASSFAVMLVYEGWGLGLGGILIYFFSARMRSAFWENFKTTSVKAFGIIGISETLTVLLNWIGYYALSIGPVALVSVVGGVRPFFAIILGYLLTLFIPSAISEDISKETLSRKILAAIILTIGLYFTYT